jgi:membrane-associated phospholipid phosphatase
MLKLLLLTGALFVCALPASAGENEKGTAQSQASRSCTDLSGEPVPCPETHNQIILPSPKSGSAEVRHCVDLTGDEAPCPGDSSSAVVATEPARTEGPAGSRVPKPASTLARTPAAATVIPASSSPKAVVSRKSKGTTTVPEASDCRDLLGDPASCPLTSTTEGVETTRTSGTQGPEEATTAAGTVYAQPVVKPQRSLERSLPRDVYLGQKDFWTFPLKMRIDDLYWAVPFAITTGGLIGSDVSIKNALPQNPNTIKRFDNISNYGAFAFGGLVGGSYLWGKFQHNTYLSDTAWLAGEAGLNGFIATYALKSILGRQRPTEGNGQGDFFSGGQSFPSEHAAAAWSIATVFAGRYPGILTKAAMFGGASLITASRVIGQKHFASDAFVGSALGFYFGTQALRRYKHEHANDAMYGTFVKRESTLSRNPANMGSAYVPLDSWIYSAIERLAAHGYAPLAYIGVKPWSRLQCTQIVAEAAEKIGPDTDAQVKGIVAALQSEFRFETTLLDGESNIGLQPESVYTRALNISGPIINDSFHFGQTLYNDFGRPYQEGFNNVTGFSARGEAGPISFYFRGEYQHSPYAAPYSQAARNAIAVADDNPVQPATPFYAINRFQVLEGYVGFTVGNNQFTFGQQPLWWGPAGGSSLLMSDNANPFLMARYSRVVPFKLPLLFKYLGPVQYDSYFGYLAGHNFPPSPWTYGQKVSFKPTPFFEIGFSRTTVFAGKGITPLTWGNFVHSYFSYSSSNKGTSTDPGDRRGGVNFSYRLPGLRNLVTLYAEGMVDDDPNPVAAPRRSAWNPGLYITHLPKLPKMDLRVESVYTNVPTGRSINGQFFYWEFIYHDSYTNDGNILGSWVGREGMGYQASSTYWFSPRNYLQFGYRNAQVAQDFMPGGVTLHDGTVKADFQLAKQWSVAGLFQYEHLNAPLLNINQQSNVTTSFQLTYWPKWSLRK